MGLSHVLTSLSASLLPYPYPATTRETFKNHACYQLSPGFTLWWGCGAISHSPPNWPQPSTQLLSCPLVLAPPTCRWPPFPTLSPFHTAGLLYLSVWIFFPLLPSSLHPGGHSSDIASSKKPLWVPTISMPCPALYLGNHILTVLEDSGAPLGDHRNPTFSRLNPSLWSKSWPPSVVLSLCLQNSLCPCILALFFPFPCWGWGKTRLLLPGQKVKTHICWSPLWVLLWYLERKWFCP